MAKRATRAEWLERVRAWKASGETRADFAAKGDYSERSLGWWAWKRGSEGEALEAKARKAKRRSARKPKSIELVELVTQTDSPKVRVFLDVAGRQAASVFGCWSADGQLGPQKGDDFRWMAWVRS